LLLPPEKPDRKDRGHHDPATQYAQPPQILHRHAIDNIPEKRVQWSQGQGASDRLQPGRQNGEGRKLLGEISIGEKTVQMMILAARNEGAMLPMALPMARKVIMPRNVTPTKAAHEPIT
jgi:hypothetical protein